MTFDRENITLCPAQKKTMEQIVELLPDGNIFVLQVGIGLGKTTLLRHLKEQIGGIFLSAQDFIRFHYDRHPFSLEESFYQMLYEALEESEIVLVDDLDLIESMGRDSMRRGVVDLVLNAICSHAILKNKKMIFTHPAQPFYWVDSCSHTVGFKRLEEEDYHFILNFYLGQENASVLNIEKIHRFASSLNLHDLKETCHFLRKNGEYTTQKFIDYLLQIGFSSNVDIEKVEYVNLADLKGIDSIIQALETHVILPFENDELSKELDLKPKKGVLLYGPPGTGKTSIGKALAHRLGGKFFLIDGTFISGSYDFYSAIDKIFSKAKKNAPSIIFIDDSDVIWETGQETGFYRYLLTQLDGLESEGEGMICVMMTAMNIARLPPALIRSGRMELWLQLHLPDGATRKSILEHWQKKLPEPLRNLELDKIVEATDGFTGADLRRLCEDAKNLYAFDRAKKAHLLSPTEYFIKAVTVVRENLQKKADAEARL